MPFTGNYIRYPLGTWPSTAETYCQTNTSAPDYGTCYGVFQKLYFVQGDTTTYPVGSLPCEQAGNCIRFTTVQWYYTFTIVDNSSIKKQILLYFVRSKHHSNIRYYNCGTFMVGTESIANPDNAFILDFDGGLPMRTRLAARSICNVYDPITNSIFDIQSQTIGYRALMEYYTNALGLKIIGAFINGMSNNTFFATIAFIGYAVESSPSLIMPLEYERYLSFNELRSVVGWAADGVSQYGWNADDIIRVLKELFPDRAWAVFDDRQYVLYLYNLTPDYVPDWLIEKLTPTAMKVLQSPADATVAKAWLDLLNERNAQISPQAELP